MKNLSKAINAFILILILILSILIVLNIYSIYEIRKNNIYHPQNSIDVFPESIELPKKK